MPDPMQSTFARMSRLFEVQQHNLFRNPWIECKRPWRDCLGVELFVLKWLKPKLATLHDDDNIDAHDLLQHTSAYFVVMVFGAKPAVNL